MEAASPTNGGAEPSLVPAGGATAAVAAPAVEAPQDAPPVAASPRELTMAELHEQAMREQQGYAQQHGYASPEPPPKTQSPTHDELLLHDRDGTAAGHSSRSNPTRWRYVSAQLHFPCRARGLSSASRRRSAQSRSPPDRRRGGSASNRSRSARRSGARSNPRARPGSANSSRPPWQSPRALDARGGNTPTPPPSGRRQRTRSTPRAQSRDRSADPSRPTAASRARSRGRVRGDGTPESDLAASWTEAHPECTFSPQIDARSREKASVRLREGDESGAQTAERLHADFNKIQTKLEMLRKDQQKTRRGEEKAIRERTPALSANSKGQRGFVGKGEVRESERGRAISRIDSSTREESAERLHGTHEHAQAVKAAKIKKREDMIRQTGAEFSEASFFLIQEGWDVERASRAFFATRPRWGAGGTRITDEMKKSSAERLSKPVRKHAQKTSRGSSPADGFGSRVPSTRLRQRQRGAGPTRPLPEEVESRLRSVPSHRQSSGGGRRRRRSTRERPGSGREAASPDADASANLGKPPPAPGTSSAPASPRLPAVAVWDAELSGSAAPGVVEDSALWQAARGEVSAATVGLGCDCWRL